MKRPTKADIKLLNQHVFYYTKQRGTMGTHWEMYTALEKLLDAYEKDQQAKRKKK